MREGEWDGWKGRTCMCACSRACICVGVFVHVGVYVYVCLYMCFFSVHVCFCVSYQRII